MSDNVVPFNRPMRPNVNAICDVLDELANEPDGDSKLFAAAVAALNMADRKLQSARGVRDHQAVVNGMFGAWYALGLLLGAE